MNCIIQWVGLYLSGRELKWSIIRNIIFVYRQTGLYKDGLISGWSYIVVIYPECDITAIESDTSLHSHLI